MATTSDIRRGLCIEFNNDIYTILEFLHVKPGKGNAFVRTKLKSLTSGKIIDHSFPAGHKINPVRVERRKYQFLYNDDSGYHFMDNETYEQISLPEDFISSPQFLKEGEIIDVLFDAKNERPLMAELPQYVILQVQSTVPGDKGNTVTNAMKPATLETGATIKVPLFINEGDYVKVNTQTGEYYERVKS